MPDVERDWEDSERPAYWEPKTTPAEGISPEVAEEQAELYARVARLQGLVPEPLPEGIEAGEWAMRALGWTPREEAVREENRAAFEREVTDPGLSILSRPVNQHGVWVSGDRIYPTREEALAAQGTIQVRRPFGDGGVTEDGYQIPGAPPVEIDPATRRRCGGPGSCERCNRDTAWWHRRNAESKAEDRGVLGIVIETITQAVRHGQAEHRRYVSKRTIACPPSRQFPVPPGQWGRIDEIRDEWRKAFPERTEESFTHPLVRAILEGAGL